jgi:hypothetical protein
MILIRRMNKLSMVGTPENVYLTYSISALK